MVQLAQMLTGIQGNVQWLIIINTNQNTIGNVYPKTSPN